MRAGLAPSSFRPPGPYFCLCFHPAPLYLAEQQEIERAIEEAGYELPGSLSGLTISPGDKTSNLL